MDPAPVELVFRSVCLHQSGHDTNADCGAVYHYGDQSWTIINDNITFFSLQNTAIKKTKMQHLCQKQWQQMLLNCIHPSRVAAPVFLKDFAKSKNKALMILALG